MFAALVEELSGRSNAELDAHLRDLELQRRALDAEFAATVAVAAARGVHLDDGHRNVAAYLRATCNCSTGEANRQRSFARLVDTVPGVGDAWLAGRLGVCQVAELARARANPRCGDRLAEIAAILIDHGERLPHPDFVRCVQRWLLIADPDGAFGDRQAAIDARTARVAEFDGVLDIAATGGDPLTAATIVAIFERFTQRELDTDLAARRDTHGDTALEHPLPRSRAQRAFDALVAIFATAHAAASTGDLPAPVLNLIGDAATFDDLLVRHRLAVAPATTPAPSMVDLLARRCETSTGTQLIDDDLLRAALTGHVRRVVVDSNGVVTDFGRRRRLFTGAAREAAKLLVRRCAHPGCMVPATTAQIDHNFEWVNDDGSTDQTNATIRCGPHNTHKHQHHLRDIRIDGRHYTRRPDGTWMLPAGTPPPDTTDHDTCRRIGRTDLPPAA